MRHFVELHPPRIQVALSTEELWALKVAAEQEGREVREQARVMIVRALQKRGLLLTIEQQKAEVPA